MPDLTVTGPRRVVHLWLRKGHLLRRGWHQRFDKPGHRSCPFCGMGQVEFKRGARCTYKTAVSQVCGAVVEAITEGDERPTEQGRLVL